MPLSKYHIRNEHSLADPELYRSANKDDPEALLEAVSMAALVGLLRQLGDLAEFAAAIFHNLHEEVMVTAARGHSLMGRVQQLEAEVPSLEKAFYSQTHHSSFFTNGGIGWHPNHPSEQNLVTRGDLPRFVMDSYEECRGPPRLFLLDKFDVAGAGACLKRYTDPSFFKRESASFGISTVEVHREKRIRKVKKKGAWLRDGEAPIVPPHSKLHQLLLEDRIENGYSNPARLVKLKKRQLNGFSAETTAGKSYMEKFLQTPSPDLKMICETSIIPQPVKLTLNDTSEAGIRILEISSINPVEKSFGNHISPNEVELQLKPFSEVNGETYGDPSEARKQTSACGTVEMSSCYPKFPREIELAVHEQKKTHGSLDGYHSDDVAREVDNYMDVLTTMESELETDNEWKPKKGFLNIQKVTDTDGKEEHQVQARLSDSQSFGDSSTSDDISSFKEDRNGVKVQARLSDSHSTGTSSTSDSISSFRRDGNEHIELQAHFSDSRSVDNSSTSDENNSFKNDKSCFTHSDSLSTVVENIPSEPIVFRYAKYHEPEVGDTSSNQMPQIVELQNTDCGKVVLHDDANVEEISDFEQASSDLVTRGLDFSSASPAELNLRLKDYENRTGLVESIAVKPVSLFLVEDDACPVDSFDKKCLNILEDDDPCVHSDDLLQVSNDLDSTCEDDYIGHSGIKMLHAESSNENSSEILVSRDAVQGVDHIFPSMEKLDLNSGTMSALDSRDSKDKDCIVGTQLNLEDLSPVHLVSCFTGEVSSDLIHDSPRGEPSSAEIEVLHSDLQSSYSSGQVINPTKHVMDPLKSPLPDLFPEANENNLDEMPPLPPLPPMQWRMGKVQHASLISQREHVEVNRVSAQPMQPIKPDQKSQSDFPTSERDTLLHQNPFMPVMAVESDKFQHSSGFPAGVSGNPVAIPFQFPIMVNDANGLYNYVVLDRNQIQNPFLALPVVSSDTPPHGCIVASEGEMLQNSNLCSSILPDESAVSGHDSISPPGNLSQSPSQITTETSSEDKTLKLSISNLESMGSPPDGDDGTLEGEMLRISNQYLTIPPAECAVFGHDSIAPQKKQTQSPSQLMMETSSAVKTLEHSVRSVVSMGMAPHGYAVASEGEILQNSNPLPPVSPAECSVSGHDSISLQENPGQLMTETSSEVKIPNQSMSDVEGEKGHPFISFMLPPNMESMEPNQNFLSSVGEMPSSFDTNAQTSDFESERINEKPKTKLPRPRNPLIDAVVAHDKSKLRRVTERVMPVIAPNVVERDSLLEQIRTKSFNLKPAAATRPSIQGPKTNLKLAAILEKANAIRHAFAGSDEDDDADSWSDS
ncbi:PREDICTED: protein SCAR2-like isoform X2 [Lupinus angustifolius]|uniref:protein SCAR2-like isoform X2 n=1 Tax=Lupinus angustifolius TaxID=3871 RepID=UPI00092E2467|nr:PREDICTED: protein SCAR2-like isoform X2 [Lupinus angustifolius]